MRQKDKSRQPPRGQVLAVVLMILLIAMTLVPVMVYLAQRESLWTVKGSRNTAAFHLAEAGIEKGYLKISQSTQTWVNLIGGGANAVLSNYHYDRTFTDVPGGTYKISITSGPGSQQATIMSLGTDTSNHETRGVMAVYSNSPLGNTAIFAAGGADIGGKVNVEWGAIISPQTIQPLYSSNSQATWPQLFSAGSITGLKTSNSPPLCDSPNCCWWHAYQTNIPAAPVLDLNYYANAAKAAKASTYGCPAGAQASDCSSGIANDCCYYQTDPSFTGLTLGPGATVYVNGNVNIASPGAYIQGSMIVMGNLSSSSGKFGTGSVTDIQMSSAAWKQYCEPTYAWPHYISTFDSAAPATFPGLNSTSYNSPKSCYPTKCSSSKVFSNGLLYVQGYMSQQGGGGGTDFYGVLYVVGTDTQTSNANNSTFYYNAAAASSLQLTQISLNRQSWQDFNP